MDCRLKGRKSHFVFFFFPWLKGKHTFFFFFFFRSLLSELWKPVRNNAGRGACSREGFQPGSIGENHVGAV